MLYNAVILSYIRVLMLLSYYALYCNIAIFSVLLVIPTVLMLQMFWVVDLGRNNSRTICILNSREIILFVLKLCTLHISEWTAI